MPGNTKQKDYKPSEDFPDLSKHNNWMAKVLTPEIYAKYRDVETPSGFTFDTAIQTGVDNPGTLKHTTTLWSLSDHYILSGNGELVLTWYRPIIMVGLMQ